MSDDNFNTLSLDEKLQKAQSQFNAIVLGILAYFKDRELNAADFIAFLGGQLAQGWDPNLTATGFLEQEAGFLISIGCTLRSVSGDADQVEAAFRSWPPDGDWTTEGFLSFWMLSQEEADIFWDINTPIADRLGYDYQWHRAGDEVMLMFTRRSKQEP